MFAQPSPSGSVLLGSVSPVTVLAPFSSALAVPWIPVTAIELANNDVSKMFDFSLIIPLYYYIDITNINFHQYCSKYFKSKLIMLAIEFFIFASDNLFIAKINSVTSTY